MIVYLYLGETTHFRRYSYWIEGNQANKVLIHYEGDHTIIAKPIPHGNSRSNKPYVRTCPSVLAQIRDNKDSMPSNVYKSSLASSTVGPDHQAVLLPRNSKQVSNALMIERNKFRLTHDALYNLHELAYDLVDFVHKITTFPDLVVIFGLKSVMVDMEQVLQLSSASQLLSYDTTFQLGDFYVSTLLFRHTLFKECPVMPVIFMIHERKFQAAHVELMKVVCELVPSLKATSNGYIPLVCDEEKGICYAIDTFLPAVKRFACWNHKIKAIKRWLHLHGSTSGDTHVYMTNVRELFHQSSYEAYNEKLSNLKEKWSSAFVDYYVNEIDPEV